MRLRLSTSAPGASATVVLRIEYAVRGNEHGILFIFSQLGEYIQAEYVRIHVILQASTGGTQYSYSCGCASGIREYVFNTQECCAAPGVPVTHT